MDSSDAQVQHASSIMERYNSLSAMSVVSMVPKAEGKSGRKLEILQLTVRLVHLVGYSDVSIDDAIDQHHVAIRNVLLLSHLLSVPYSNRLLVISSPLC